MQKLVQWDFENVESFGKFPAAVSAVHYGVEWLLVFWAAVQCLDPTPLSPAINPQALDQTLEDVSGKHFLHEEIKAGSNEMNK